MRTQHDAIAALCREHPKRFYGMANPGPHLSRKEYDDEKIVMAHCGQMVFANEAAAVFAASGNVCGDTSWTPGVMIKNWLRTGGPRFLLGTDHADNTGTELAKVRTVGLTLDEQDSVLGSTAGEVFGFR